MNYRAGWPGWKLVARAGGTIVVKVDVMKDNEAGVYVASSGILDGLVVVAKSLDDFRLEVIGAALSLLELAMNCQPPTHAVTDVRFSDAVLSLATKGGPPALPGRQ